MMTLMVVIGLITLLGGGFYWAVRMGKKMQRLENFEVGKEKMGSVSEFNRRIDEETDRKIKSGGDSPVGGAWLRNK